MKYFLRFVVVIILFSSCKTYKTKYPYSLGDFNPELRRHLEKIVQNGGSCLDLPDAHTYLFEKTSDYDLQRLIKSEHPLLRAYAFDILCDKKDASVSKLLIEHLDDTSIINFCMGEFGDKQEPVADYFIQQSRGCTNIPKSTLFEMVVSRHPYLIHGGSFFIDELGTEEKYYPYLKRIVEKKYAWHYYMDEELIIKLSNFKKNEDTMQIARALDHAWLHKKDRKFYLIENNPIQPYFFVVKNYYETLFKMNDQKILQLQFLQDQEFNETFERFIYATAAYKSNEAASILESILMNKLYKVDKEYPDFQYQLYDAITKYDCPHYKKIIPLIKVDADYFAKRYLLSPMETTIDTTTIKVRNTW